MPPHVDRYLELIAQLRAAPAAGPGFGAMVVRQVASLLRVARVGWWRMRQHPEAGLVLEAGWWDGADQGGGAESFLPRHAFPRYFAALDSGVPIVAVDATTDPRTSEFLDVYLRPKGIGAMLDAAAQRGGVVTGVVCVEHIGGPREWRDAEVQFVSTLVGLLAQRDAERAAEATFLRLRDSEHRYRELFDSSPDLLQSTDPTGRFHFVNDTWRRTLGYSDPEVEQLTLSSLVHPDHAARLQELYTAVLAGRTVSQVRLDVLARDGRRVSLAGSFVPSLQGMRVHGCHAFLRPVENETHADAEPTADAALFRVCLDALPEALFLVDSAFDLQFANRAAADQFPSATGAQGLRAVADPLSLQRMHEAASAGAPVVLQACRLRRADGRYAPVDLAMSPAVTPAGRMTVLRLTEARTPSP